MEKSVQPEQSLNELFFELSSSDRRRILSELRLQNLRLHEIAKRFDMTATEALRQLQKLSETSLVEKLPDGNYKLTTYAKLALDTASPLDFVSKYKKYFLDHDVFLLPYEFRDRIGELSGCELILDTIDTFNKVTELFRSAQKQIDAVILGTEALIEIERHRADEGLKIRWLMHESFSERTRVLLESWMHPPEIRSTPRVVGHIVVTDKAALLTLRHNDGTMSYESFVSEDPLFTKWASDLFNEEWEKAKPWHTYMGNMAVPIADGA